MDELIERYLKKVIGRNKILKRFKKVIFQNYLVYKLRNPLEINPVSFKLSEKAINKVGKPIYIVIDSESEFKIISKLIENSKYQFSSPNGTIDRYF